MVPIRYNLRSLAVRKATTLATALGIGLVVFVLAGSLMLAEGIAKTLGVTGQNDIAVVLRKGGDAELSSTIEEPQVGLITAMPGVKMQNGKPVAIAESVVVTAVEKIGADGITNMQLRGVPSNVRDVRTTFRVVAGRIPNPGADECMVGARIRGRLRGADLEQSFELKKNRPVKVVGIFEDNGSSSESEVWVDLDVLRSSFGREGTVSSVRVKLEGASKQTPFKNIVEQDKRLGLSVLSEPVFFEKQSSGTSLFIKVLGNVVTVFFSLGAIIGASITMSAAVANRRREIGTLRALGFSRSAILLSFVLESLLLSALGGGLGILGALGLKSVKFSLLNFATWSETVFGFEPTPGILMTAMVFALFMGFFGGLIPAFRASRISPVVAMRG
jgi:putative ABC transport system permease protein